MATQDPRPSATPQSATPKKPSWRARQEARHQRVIERGQTRQQSVQAWRDRMYGREPLPDPSEALTQVITYQSPDDMARGINQMVADGWHIAGQSSYTPRKGVGRTILGGLLFFNRKPVTVVTFTRAPRA